MSNRVGEIAVVNGQSLQAKEEFRASGTKWVRYQDSKGENRYATQEEWDIWVALTGV